jgi:hypothetical protein
MREAAHSKDADSARAPSATNAVLVAVGLTAAACALVAFAHAKLYPPPEPKRCRCVAPASSVDVRPQNGALVRAIAALASARVEVQPAEPSAPCVVEPHGDVAIATAEAFEPSFEERRAKEQADADTLDAQLASEEADPFWGPRTERATVDAVARLGNDLRVTEVTCRESLCRARLIHHDARLAGADMERLLSIPVIAAQAMAVAPPGGAGGTLLYFSRKGMPLSVFQPPVYMGQGPIPGSDGLDPPSEAQP